MAKPRRIQSLDVSVVDSDVGELRWTQNNVNQRCNFTYRQGLDDGLSVALNMPTAERDYASEDLLPPFEQSLPEMDLSVFPPAIWKLVAKDRMGSLWASSRRRIGRLRLNSGEMDDVEPPAPVQIRRADLASADDGDALFQDMLKSLLDIPGISGVQPKALVRLDESTEDGREIVSRAPRTLSTDTHILKSNHPRYTGATVVESFCLDLAEMVGLEVPRRLLSKDGRLLAVERFDLDMDGHPLGFDEICALQGRLAKEKYDGTMEEVAAAVREFAGSMHVRESVERLFVLVALNNAVRNGDGHLKNFGLVYARPAEARLSPVYDVLTTTCFDNMAHDAPALSLRQRRQWDDYEGLRRFGEQHCGMGRADMRKCFERVAAAMQRMLPEIMAARERYPFASAVLWSMRADWITSLEILERDACR